MQSGMYDLALILEIYTTNSDHHMKETTFQKI